MEKKQKFASDTSQRSVTDWIRALLALLVGLIIAHLGVTLFLLSALGTDTFTVFIQGLSRVVGLSIGLAGCVILSLGMSIVINSNAGTGPNDLVAVILSDKLERIEFRWVRMGCDAFFVILGFILGGTVGVGTIIAIFLTGPMVQFWLPKTKALLQKIRV